MSNNINNTTIPYEYTFDGWFKSLTLYAGDPVSKTGSGRRENLIDLCFTENDKDYLETLFSEYYDICVDSNLLYEQMSKEIQIEKKIYKNKVRKIRKKYHKQRLLHCNKVLNKIMQMKEILCSKNVINLNKIYIDRGGKNKEHIIFKTSSRFCFYAWVSRLLLELTRSYILKDTYGIKKYSSLKIVNQIIEIQNLHKDVIFNVTTIIDALESKKTNGVII
jgi:hypothetical protein